MAAMCMTLATTSCSQKEGKSDADAQAAIAAATRQELEEAVSDREELLSLMGDIQQDIMQIKSLENIVSVTSNETPSKKEQIKADIAAIQQTLAERQERLNDLTKRLQSSNMYSEKLKKTIDDLQSQITNQTAEIQRLTGELDSAKAQIATLGTQVDSLNTTVNVVTEQRDVAEQQTVEANNELNKCYYAIGSNKELKDHKILESGFLRKTKIMKGDFDQKFFTTADKRTLTTIPLNSKKAEVMTNQPKDSYNIQEGLNGQKTLVITDPAKFWSLTNYLVIKVD